MADKKRALITGITGQDGSYLAELLLDKGYEVFGVVRRLSAPNVWRIQHLLDRVTLLQADLLDQLSLIKAVERSQPDEVYNLAAHVLRADLVGPADAHRRVQRAGRHAHARGRSGSVNPKIRFYQASSSEMFGKVREVPQTEMTPFYPRSPYGVAKVYGHYITVNYRESYDLFAVSGILFNHESPRRGIEFVTRKVTDGVARIKLGLADTLTLGNLDARRDWGFAGRLRPRDVADAAAGPARTTTSIATGERALGAGAGGAGLRATSASTGRSTCGIDPAFLRPAEVDHLIGDPTKAQQATRLGAQRGLRGPRDDDGGRRPRAAEVRSADRLIGNAAGAVPS